MKLQWKAATSADEQWLDRLRRDAYRDLFHATWGGWDEARHARHFAKTWERGSISLLEVDAVLVGMVQLLDGADAWEVGEIQIAPSHQGRGIGTAVLRDVTKRAQEEGKAVRLSVGLQNQGALRFYERLGFQVVEKTETHHNLIWEPGS